MVGARPLLERGLERWPMALRLKTGCVDEGVCVLMRPRPQVKEDKEKVYFGVQADSRIFDLYRTLLMEPKGPTPQGESARSTLIPTTTR